MTGAPMTDLTKDDVVVHAEGDVSPAEREYAADKISRTFAVAPAPVLFAKVDIVRHADPAHERPVFVKAEVDVNGRVVRARAAAPTSNEAIDALEDRLRERLERAAHLQESRHLRHRDEAWHHGDPPSERTPYFPRPVDEREVVRRKTFAIGAQTPEEAALDMAMLDHDFFLFHNAETDEDNVLFRTPDGLALIQPSEGWAPPPESGIAVSTIRPARMDEREAIQLLDLGDEPFVFFLDPDSGKGAVVYRRYDGHYGVIQSAVS